MLVFAVCLIATQNDACLQSSSDDATGEPLDRDFYKEGSRRHFRTVGAGCCARWVLRGAVELRAWFVLPVPALQASVGPAPVPGCTDV